MGQHSFWTLLKTAHWWVVFVLLAVPASAQEETSIQPWFSVVLGHQKSESLYMEVEIQPKTQISGGEHWRNIDATWNVEYYPTKWFDLTCELVTGYTNHTNDLSSFEVTPRPGLRLHLAKQTVMKIDRHQKLLTQRIPLKRFGLDTWLRWSNGTFSISEIWSPVTSGVSGSVLSSRSPSTTLAWAMTEPSMDVGMWNSFGH